MGEKKNNLFMVAIVICLLIIAFKDPEPYYVPTNNSTYFPDTIEVNNEETVIQISENIIGIINSSNYSGGQGNITVLEFNPEEKSFEILGEYNYLNGTLSAP